MRKIIIEEWVSLDGYVADSVGSLNFFTTTVKDTYTEAIQKEHLESMDCILFGRKTYELFSSLWPERPVENNLLAAKINTCSKIVFSASLLEAPWGKWGSAKIESRHVVKTIADLKSSQGGNIVVWGSISLAQMLLKEKLADELRLHICPVILGGGRKLFEDDFELLHLSTRNNFVFSNGNVLLNYKIDG
jgi:dihydrofolate reductase